ncbi:MAG: hypothetical protein IJ935_20555 [Afipia sp.]|nr:hypothetical protein [Afipia sp.]
MPRKQFWLQLDKPTSDFVCHIVRVNVIVALMRAAIRDKIISFKVEAVLGHAGHPE